MDSLGSGEVLEHGSARSGRSRIAGGAVTAIVAAAMVIAAVAAGTTWWAGRPPTSTELAVVDIAVTGTRPVTVVAEPPIGALATPAGAALPGVTLRLTVGGDPARATEVTTSASDSLVFVDEGPAVGIPPGGFVDIDVTVAPVDCALAREGTDLDEAGYRWRRPFGVELVQASDGTTIPLSDRARASLSQALEQACEDAGTPPELTIAAARRGGEPPLETIGLIVDVAANADRLVLTPLDGPGLRGLGSADRATGARIPLLWLVSTRAEHNEDVPTAYTQVYVIRDGIAYPWIVGTPITDDLPEMTPLTPLRNDGVDLAEVAPRP